MAKKIKKVNDQLEKEFNDSMKNIDIYDPTSIAIAFGTWLNLYFDVWSPTHNTWIDSNNHATTTEELWDEFNKEFDLLGERIIT